MFAGDLGSNQPPIFLPGVAVGLAVALLTRRFIDRDRFRHGILVVAAISGILLVLH